jgi:hypothetical protein
MRHTPPYSLLIAAIATGVLTFGPPAAKAVDLDEVTVITLSRDGSWGLATAASLGHAIAAAIRDCRATASSQAIAARNSQRHVEAGWSRICVATERFWRPLPPEKTRRRWHSCGKRNSGRFTRQQCRHADAF